MIKNYLKAALASMWRRKWFSLLTLFSIAISLVVVTCCASMWNMITVPFAPEVNKDRTFFLDIQVTEKASGRKVEIVRDRELFLNNFFLDHISQLTTPEVASVHTTFSQLCPFFKDGRKKMFHFCRTDKNFFTVFDFKFLKGKSFQDKDPNGEMAWCIISKELGDFYFNGEDCIGKVIATNPQAYRVSGVFEKSTAISVLKSDILVQLDPKKDIRFITLGIPEVAFLCPTSGDKTALDKELNNLAGEINRQHPKWQVEMASESSTMILLNDFFSVKEQFPLFIAFILIVLILPVLCLIDVLRNSLDNRIEELGIRKAFGASRTIIRTQLLFENVIITVLGGILGLIFSFSFFLMLSDASAYNLFRVFFDWRSFFYYMLTFSLIGTLAGVIPAYKISATPITRILNKSRS